MWFKIKNQQVKITILVKPNAKKTAILGIGQPGLLVSIHAKPHKGAANKELISYLSMLLRLPKHQIILNRGKGSKHKQLELPLTDTVQQLLDDPTKFVS